jgi:hypothetical protein
VKKEQEVMKNLQILKFGDIAWLAVDAFGSCRWCNIATNN